MLVGILSLFGDRQGGLATIAAVLLPVLIVVAGGGVDIVMVTAERQQFRTIAEGAALAGASELALASDRRVAAERARAWAETAIQEWENAPQATVNATIEELDDGERGVRVTITANRASIMGRLLPPGGWTIEVSAVAASANRTPLCILATRGDNDKIVQVRGQSSIRAPGCLIHSNQDIVVEGTASIRAGVVRAVGRISGAQGASGASRITDPFGDLDLNPPRCSDTDFIVYDTGTRTLPAGVHCDNIEVKGTAVLRLAPGEHWFVSSELKAEDDARIEGSDVILLFDKDGKFSFHDRALVRLDGRERGRFAGFVMAAVRNNRHDFIITSQNVESLLGVIYVPNAKLVINGRAEVARESAWTVLVAQQIKLDGNPTLFINANYDVGDVPVPTGVGPTTTETRLVQ